MLSVQSTYKFKITKNLQYRVRHQPGLRKRNIYLDPQTPKEEVFLWKGSLLPVSHKHIQENSLEIQSGLHSIGYYHQVRVCQAEGNIYVKVKEKLTRTQWFPAGCWPRIRDWSCLPRLLAKRRKVTRHPEICVCKEAKNKKGEAGRETTEHRKSKRRKYHWYAFFQGKKGHAHLLKKNCT